MITLKESYWALRRNRWKILATRSIRKITIPDKNTSGRIVSRSIIPLKENKNRIRALTGSLFGYKKSAVQIRNAYSTQKTRMENISTLRNNWKNASSSSKVCKNVTAILQTITATINMSNARLAGLLLYPIWIILKIFFAKIFFFTDLFTVHLYPPPADCLRQM